MKNETSPTADSHPSISKKDPHAGEFVDDETRALGLAPTTCIEHAYGSAYRLSFQIKVF